MGTEAINTWRISEEEYLLQGRSHRIHLSLSVNRVLLPGGERINSANEYLRVSGSGDVLEWFRGPRTSTLEEYLYVSDIHCVLDATLRRFFWTERHGCEEEILAKTLIERLVVVSESEVPFNPIRIIEDHEQRNPRP